MSLKNLLFCCFILLFSSVIVAQNNAVIISGTVTDSLQKPLANVTLIAKPKQEKLKITFAISDSDGFYKLQLERGVSYELRISHLGYDSKIKEFFF